MLLGGLLVPAFCGGLRLVGGGGVLDAFVVLAKDSFEGESGF